MDNPIMPFYPGWETVRVIDSSANGAVYELRREGGGAAESAALKLISLPGSPEALETLRHGLRDEDAVARVLLRQRDEILREYTLMQSLGTDANIVDCPDVFHVAHMDDPGWDIYVRMELLTPLRTALGVNRVLPEREVLRLGIDIARALSRCEAWGVLHGNLSPRAVYVAANGDYRLGGFTFAGRGMVGALGEAKYFMAPEAIRGEPCDSRADIYSLGLLLYWLLNRRRLPFLPPPPALPRTTELEQATARRATGEAFPPSAYGSSELRRIVQRACAAAPEDRYPDAAAFLLALETLRDRQEAQRDRWQRPAAAAVAAAPASPGEPAEDAAEPYPATAELSSDTPEAAAPEWERAPEGAPPGKAPNILKALKSAKAPKAPKAAKAPRLRNKLFRLRRNKRVLDFSVVAMTAVVIVGLAAWSRPVWRALLAPAETAAPPETPAVTETELPSPVPEVLPEPAPTAPPAETPAPEEAEEPEEADPEPSPPPAEPEPPEESPTLREYTLDYGLAEKTEHGTYYYFRISGLTPYVFAPHGAGQAGKKDLQTVADMLRTYGPESKLVCAFNSGIFYDKTADKVYCFRGHDPDGVLIAGGIVLKSAESLDHTQCDILVIDEDGNPGWADYYADADALAAGEGTYYDINGDPVTGKRIISAVTGFVPIVVGGQSLYDAEDGLLSGFDNYVNHYAQRASRQVFGVREDGTSIILSNEDSWTLADAAEAALAEGCVFAYNLDGGTSVDSAVAGEDGEGYTVHTEVKDKTGVTVPTFLVFSAYDTPPVSAVPQALQAVLAEDAVFAPGVTLREIAAALRVTETFYNADGRISQRQIYSAQAREAEPITQVLLGRSGTRQNSETKKETEAPAGTLFYTKTKAEQSDSLRQNGNSREGGQYYDYSTGFTVDCPDDLSTPGVKSIQISYAPGGGREPMTVSMSIIVTP